MTTTAVQDIEELQRGLRAVFPEVEADGDIGRITTAAVIHVRDSRFTALAKSLQTILRRTTPDLVVDGNIGAKTMAALRKLDELGDIESAAIVARPVPGDDGRHWVQASSFADAADVAAFHRCKARGGSDIHCFGVGDNGIGARGANCAQMDRPMIALPREHWRQLGAKMATATAPGDLFVLTFDLIEIEAELGDTMPSVENIHNGAGMDTNPAVAAKLNEKLGRQALRAPFMKRMAWRLKAAAALILFWFGTAAAVSAADVQGKPAAVATLRPAFLLADAMGQFVTPPYVFSAVVTMLLIGGWMMWSHKLRKTLIEDVREALGQKPEMQIGGGPVLVRADVSFVAETQFKELEDYVHKMKHGVANQIQHLELATEERRTEAAEQQAAVMKELQNLGEKLDGKRSADIAAVYGELRQHGSKIAAVEKEATIHTAQLNTMDVKLTNILQRLPRSRGGND